MKTVIFTVFFCTEKKDSNAPDGDTSSTIVNAGIVRSKDLRDWERLPDLISNSQQQRNVNLHPEFVDGRYAIYTRPQDGFIETDAGGGIGLGFAKNMENPEVLDEVIINPKKYHTIYELKNGQGPSPIKTSEGIAASCPWCAQYRSGITVFALYVYDRFK